LIKNKFVYFWRKTKSKCGLLENPFIFPFTELAEIHFQLYPPKKSISECIDKKYTKMDVSTKN
jgi:hypothetical protein